MTIEAWRFGDPATIIDALIAASTRNAQYEKKRQANLRKHKARRIRALVKKARLGYANIR